MIKANTMDAAIPKPINASSVLFDVEGDTVAMDASLVLFLSGYYVLVILITIPVRYTTRLRSLY